MSSFIGNDLVAAPASMPRLPVQGDNLERRAEGVAVGAIEELRRLPAAVIPALNQNLPPLILLDRAEDRVHPLGAWLDRDIPGAPEAGVLAVRHLEAPLPVAARPLDVVRDLNAELRRLRAAILAIYADREGDPTDLLRELDQALGSVFQLGNDISDLRRQILRDREVVVLRRLRGSACERITTAFRNCFNVFGRQLSSLFRGEE